MRQSSRFFHLAHFTSAALIALALSILPGCSPSAEPVLESTTPVSTASASDSTANATCLLPEPPPPPVANLENPPSKSRDFQVKQALQAFEAAFAAAQYDQALACAEKALELGPQRVDAHQSKAVALDVLGKVAKAHAAYEQMLALAPNDAESLRAAADFHLRLGDVDSLEEAIRYARRGRDTAESLPLAAELSAMAAKAANVLGRPAEALLAAEAALVFDPNEPVAAVERAIALFELLQFEESRKAFKVVLARSARSPRALWYAGLLRERHGNDAEAERLFRKAARLDPEKFPVAYPMADHRFQALAEETWRSLIDEGAVTDDVSLIVEELPALEDLEGEPKLSPTIASLRRGAGSDVVEAVDRIERGEGGERVEGGEIVLFRRNLLRSVRGEDELREAIRKALLHPPTHTR